MVKERLLRSIQDLVFLTEEKLQWENLKKRENQVEPGTDGRLVLP